MNSVFVNLVIYSCAVDAFLEISAHLFLPYLSSLRADLLFMFARVFAFLFRVCTHYMSSRENSSCTRRSCYTEYQLHSCNRFIWFVDK